MPLQNRVDPFGAIHAVDARGRFTGNRGVIHDPATRTLLARRWTTKAWIVCACAFRGRRRDVMGRNAPSGNAGWTELFFLDEATALAAGHRPCFYCRRDRAVEFARCFSAGLGRKRMTAPEIDAVLHRERLASATDSVGAPSLLASLDPSALPDGAMISLGDRAFAVRDGAALPWSFQGYGAPVRLSEAERISLRLLTPPSTVAALASGYRPAWP